MFKNILKLHEDGKIIKVYLFDWIFNLYISYNKQMVVITGYIAQSILIAFYQPCLPFILLLNLNFPIYSSQWLDVPKFPS